MGSLTNSPSLYLRKGKKREKIKENLGKKKKKSFLGKKTTKESPGLQMKREKEKDKFSLTRGRFEVAMEYWNNDV